MRRMAKKTIAATFYIVLCFSVGFAQSRHSVRTTDDGGLVLNVTANRTKGTDPIKIENLFLYENGIEQKIKNFVYDPAPARIVLMVDNSQTVRADAEKLHKAMMEFAYEIFDGDQLYVVAYDEKPEILQEWTDDSKKLDEALKLFRKKGNPFLFDAISATVNEVLLPLMPGTHKTAIVLISDGLDRGSKMTFDKTLAELQNYNVTFYALQLPDRTGGAYRRDTPKAGAVINKLTEGTGGRTFEFAEAKDAAATICDELRKNRYILSYTSTNFSSYDARRVFLLADDGIVVRTKNAQPPTVK